MESREYHKQKVRDLIKEILDYDRIDINHVNIADHIDEIYQEYPDSYSAPKQKIRN